MKIDDIIEQLSDFKEDLSEKDEIIKNLKAELKEKDEIISEQDKEIQDLDEKIAKFRDIDMDALNLLQDTISNIIAFHKHQAETMNKYQPVKVGVKKIDIGLYDQIVENIEILKNI